MCRASRGAVSPYLFQADSEWVVRVDVAAGYLGGTRMAREFRFPMLQPFVNPTPGSERGGEGISEGRSPLWLRSKHTPSRGVFKRRDHKNSRIIYVTYQ